MYSKNHSCRCFKGKTKPSFSLRELSLYLLSATCCLFLTKQTLFAQEQGYTDGIVAVVNDDVITVYDVASYNAEFERQIQSRYTKEDLKDSEKRKRLYNQINENRIQAAHKLIDEKLIYAEFSKNGYQFPAEIVDKRIDSMVASYTGGDWGKFEGMLADSNTSMEQFRERIERRLAVDVLISQTVDRNIIISPLQIKKFYQKYADRYSEPRKILLQIILLDPNESKSKDAHEITIDKVTTAINDGGDFAELASTYSHHVSKKNGGELGWIKESDVRAEFRKSLATMEKGVVSSQFQLDGVTYFIRVGDVKDGIDQPLSEVYEEIKRELYEKEKKKRYDNYIAELREKAYVRIFFQE